ncbi:hypothetical protein D3C76_881410 [compost metagenome]
MDNNIKITPRPKVKLRLILRTFLEACELLAISASETSLDTASGIPPVISVIITRKKGYPNW